MLAYNVEWHMRQALKPILQSLIEHVEEAMTVLLVRLSVEMSCLKGERDDQRLCRGGCGSGQSHI